MLKVFKLKDIYFKASERHNNLLEYYLKDKIHQIYPLEKFLKDVKRLFKPKDIYFKASERHNNPLE
jgi:hypothetical protein